MVLCERCYGHIGEGMGVYIIIQSSSRSAESSEGKTVVSRETHVNPGVDGESGSTVLGSVLHNVVLDGNTSNTSGVHDEDGWKINHEGYMEEFLKYDSNSSASFWRKYMKVRVMLGLRMPLKKI